MSQKVMQLDNLYDFSLVRYEPGSIILVEKRSRKPYEFFQQSNLNTIKPQICHPNLLRPILYKNGLLYERGCENLSNLLDQRRRDYSPLHYSPEEIQNTFEPIIECLQFLHQKGISYSHLSGEHIVFFQSGDIFLKDWLFKRDQKDLSEFDRKKDLKNIGIIMASIALLMPEKEVSKLNSSEIVSMLVQHYHINFCIALVILLEGFQKYYTSVVNLIRSEQSEQKFVEVKSIIDEGLEIKNVRQKQRSRQIQKSRANDKLLKEVQNQKLKVETPRKQEQKSILASLQGSPTKKFNISTPNKKLIRLQDCENKKVFNEQVKKRQIEKITKIIERSNAFVNELMARKNNDKKYLNSKVNSSMIETQQNSKKTAYVKQSPKIGSPTKRLRSISKKK